MQGWSTEEFFNLCTFSWLTSVHLGAGLHPAEFFASKTPHELIEQTINAVALLPPQAMKALGMPDSSTNKLVTYPRSLIREDKAQQLGELVAGPTGWNIAENDYTRRYVECIYTALWHHEFPTFGRQEPLFLAGYMAKQSFDAFAQLVLSSFLTQCQKQVDNGMEWPLDLVPGMWSLHEYHQNVTENCLEWRAHEVDMSPEEHGALNSFLDARCVHHRQEQYKFPKREEAKTLLWMYYLGYTALHKVPQSLNDYLDQMLQWDWPTIQQERFFRPNIGLRWNDNYKVMVWFQAPEEQAQQAREILQSHSWWQSMPGKFQTLSINLIAQVYGWPGYHNNMRYIHMLEMCRAAEQNEFTLLWLQARASQNIILYCPPPDEGAEHN